MIQTYEHIPVMLERSLELLAPALDADAPLVIDATLGLGGHSEALLERFPALRVIGIDRDSEAIAHASHRLHRFAPRFTAVHARYDQIGEVLEAHAPGRDVHGVLFDLGVSSLHLDKPERGFSYSVDAPLDMRMNQQAPLTAAAVLADYSEAELADIFRRFGDEKLAARYAKAIVHARSLAPLERTGELVAVLQEATPYALRDQGHPAKRVFQALRIEVNQELDSLYSALPQALDLLCVGGRIVVLSYQSGEDRFVKLEVRRRSQSLTPLGVPAELPGLLPEFVELTRGAEKASAEEISRNPRAASVRLRAAQRLRKAPR